MLNVLLFEQSASIVLQKSFCISLIVWLIVFFIKFYDITPYEQLVVICANAITSFSWRNYLNVRFVKNMGVKFKLLGFIMESEPRYVQIIILILNNHCVLTNSKIFGIFRVSIFILKIYHGWYIFTFNHIDSYTWGNSHLSCIILAPCIQSSILHPHNREIINRVELRYVIDGFICTVFYIF